MASTSCDPYPDPVLLIKKDLLGEWFWERSYSVQYDTEETPESTGEEWVRIFYDNDKTEIYYYDTLHSTKDYSIEAKIYNVNDDYSTFTLRIGTFSRAVRLSRDSLIFVPNSTDTYSHYYSRVR